MSARAREARLVRLRWTMGLHCLVCSLPGVVLAMSTAWIFLDYGAQTRASLECAKVAAASMTQTPKGAHTPICSSGKDTIIVVNVTTAPSFSTSMANVLVVESGPFLGRPCIVVSAQWPTRATTALRATLRAIRLSDSAYLLQCARDGGIGPRADDLSLVAGILLCALGTMYVVLYASLSWNEYRRRRRACLRLPIPSNLPENNRVPDALSNILDSVRNERRLLLHLPD